MKATRPYPYLYRDIDRQGAQRWRLRAPGRPTRTIKGDYGSPEFAANYRAALEGDSVPVAINNKHGTFNALGRSYLRSAAFMALAPATQRAWRYLIEQFLSSFLVLTGTASSCLWKDTPANLAWPAIRFPCFAS